MKDLKIIIAGGTGFIGQSIANYFGNDHEVIILSRQLKAQQTNRFGETSKSAAKNIRYVKWDAESTGAWAKELEGAHLIINLAGKTVNCRYTAKNKKEIFNSRLLSTKAIGGAIQQCTSPPKLWLNAASASIYPHATIAPRDESFTAFENDFSVQVCKAWEKTFFEQRTPFTRKIALRMAITIGSAGIMTPYFNLLKFGLGGKQGNGKQWYSWIHIEDTCRIIEWMYDHTEMEGVYNLSSPGPVTNNEFMKTLRKTTGHKFGLPAQEWMLRLGAILIGTEPELVLKSRWVLPAKLLATGYKFKYPEIEGAFKDIVAQTKKKKYHLF